MKCKAIRLALLILLMTSEFCSFAGQGQDVWASYIDASVGKNTYYLYQQVMNGTFLHNKSHRALSLGAGAGEVDIDLASRGWEIMSVDSSPRSHEILNERMKLIPAKFEFQLSDFEHTVLKGDYDLVVSFFALPFGEKNNLPVLIENISKHMKKNAIFAVNFFGNTHTYVINGQAYGITQDELSNLLTANGMQIKFFLNRHFTQAGLHGEIVNWDVLDVIAKKR